MGLIDFFARRSGYVSQSDVETIVRDKIAAQRRAFQSAQISNITHSMSRSPKPIDVDVRAGLRILRARSREESQNNDYAKAFIGLLKSEVTGHNGIIMRSRVIDPGGNKDPLASKALEDGWREFAKKGVIDVTGRHSWRSALGLFIETVARDGEVLIRHVRGWSGNKFRYAIQFLDTELLDVDYNVTLKNGNVIKMGVELDEWRRPVNYHLLTTKQTDDTYSHGGRRYQVVPADEIIHEFLPEWVWQTRGIPWMATALLRMNMLSGYEEAELVASRAGAAKFAVYEKVDDEAPVWGGEDGPALEQDGNSGGQFVQDFESGTVEITPDGYRLNLIDPQHPNSSYTGFVKACLRGISAGLGVNYNDLANDLEGVNYNSLRHGAIKSRAVWMLLQNWVIESFCEPVANNWLNMSLLAGTMTINGKPLKIEREENYRRRTWQPKRWQWVDPLKEMNANEKAFQNKIKSPQSVIREMGDDPEQVLDDWEEWQNELDRRGIKMDSATTDTATMEPGNGNQDANN